jgi:hypothetical protein
VSEALDFDPDGDPKVDLFRLPMAVELRRSKEN